jgi:hypothetical protein
MSLGQTMSRIFLSHSSANNAEAVGIRNWLAAEGWNEVFLDLDPERGIVAGERWERALNEAASRCEVVLFLISQRWLDSRWCLNEFNLARKLNKRLFAVLIEAIPVEKLPVGAILLGDSRQNELLQSKPSLGIGLTRLPDRILIEI